MWEFDLVCLAHWEEGGQLVRITERGFQPVQWPKERRSGAHLSREWNSSYYLLYPAAAFQAKCRLEKDWKFLLLEVSLDHGSSIFIQCRIVECGIRFFQPRTRTYICPHRISQYLCLPILPTCRWNMGPPEPQPCLQACHLEFLIWWLLLQVKTVDTTGPMTGPCTSLVISSRQNSMNF